MASFPIRPFIFIATLLSLSVALTPSYAANEKRSNQRGDYYVGVGANYTQLLIGDAEFNPTVIRLRGGVFVLNNIALELQLGKGIDSDSPFDSLDIEIDQLQAFYARFQSPTQRGFRIYFQGGYARTELLQSDHSDDEINNSFSGISYGFGFEDQFKYYKPLYFYFEANQLFNDEIDINSANLGIRYTFN
ncbi:MAG: hypothetical protein COB51_14265 [Moraxellaceae bacterium]|nr:MAG: hypothetical protein COB51_14265 [Moraxellaceae bacterium]